MQPVAVYPSVEEEKRRREVNEDGHIESLSMVIRARKAHLTSLSPLKPIGSVSLGQCTSGSVHWWVNTLVG